MTYLIHCQNLCKGGDVPPSSTTIKEKKSLDQIISQGQNFVCLCVSLSDWSKEWTGFYFTYLIKYTK
jgi:hypothetical protein